MIWSVWSVLSGAMHVEVVSNALGHDRKDFPFGPCDRTAVLDSGA